MLEQYSLPLGQEHRSRPAGTDTDTDSVQREEHRAEENSNSNSSLEFRSDSFHHLRQTIQHRSSPLGAPWKFSQSRCVQVDLMIVCVLQSCQIFSSHSLRRTLFSSTPVFMFPHGSPCHPRHPSAWFNFSWKSSSVFVPLCSGKMFDAAKIQLTPKSGSFHHQKTHTFTWCDSLQNISLKCLPRCSSNQTLCSHPELPTHLSPTARS